MHHPVDRRGQRAGRHGDVVPPFPFPSQARASTSALVYGHLAEGTRGFLGCPTLVRHFAAFVESIGDCRRRADEFGERGSDVAEVAERVVARRRVEPVVCEHVLDECVRACVHVHRGGGARGGEVVQ